ncbi:MAG: response regulator transcription factor, partial [Sphingomonadaceae bacterium]
MSQPHILIVEDSASLALGYAAQLSSAGYTADLCGTGAEAERYFTESPLPEVILLDLQLPDANGLDLLRIHE